MLSRTADHLFWMARYIELADNRGNAAVASNADLRAARVKRARRAAVDRTRGVAMATTSGVLCASGDARC
jgi:uncharacterized alpha-E superfamily protein